jgi:3-methyladenine DNA glycosylase AlkD
MSILYNFVGSYDVQMNNFVDYQQTVFQVENDLSREQMLNLFANLYEEIRVQSSMVLEDLDFDVTKETKDIINKLNNPYS